ncbi:unnamed protein product [Brassica napus]|uniref:(rape) hypothetical protein n=1 Tax=Brassica napus TaxID=3708 RepID=A0A816JW80_BRANA|nr:unnamed protein product [Brassica napus]
MGRSLLSSKSLGSSQTDRPGMATFSHLLAALKAGRCNTTAKVWYLYPHAPPITCDQKTYLLKHSMRSSHMQRGGTATIKGRDNAPPPFKCDCSIFGRPGTSEAVLNSWSGYAHRFNVSEGFENLTAMNLHQ